MGGKVIGEDMDNEESWMNSVIYRFMVWGKGDIMNADEIKKYCLGKHGAYETQPFGDVPICYKLNNKIFAQLYPYEHDYKITLKCTADVGDFYRMIYPYKVVRGYHCPPVQQPYWNTIYLADFPEDELYHMIDLAYDTVLNSFSKKVQKEILSREK